MIRHSAGLPVLQTQGLQDRLAKAASGFRLILAHMVQGVVATWRMLKRTQRQVATTPCTVPAVPPKGIAAHCT